MSAAATDTRANRVFILLGSNIDPQRHLRLAVEQLARQVRLVAVSPVYETAPVGKTDQPNFLNAAALIETALDAAALKAQVLRPIEAALGRVRSADKNAPRTIDLDIVLFNQQVLDVGGQHIPDPDLLFRPHIAVPLADLAPAYRHPETGETLSEIAGRLPQEGIRRRSDIALRREM